MVEVPVAARSGIRYIIGQAFSPEFFSRSFAGSAIPPSWSIVVGAPVEENDHAVWHGILAMGIGLFVAMAAALTLTILTGRRLVHFVASASHAARPLGRGERVESLEPSSIVELDELNEAILEASGRVQVEVRSRSQAEHERNELLVLEKDARARAEEQNAAKDEFLAMLGHELRNPLAV